MARSKTPDRPEGDAAKGGKPKPDEATDDAAEDVSDAKPESTADVPTQPISAAQIDAAKNKNLPDIEPPPPKGEPWPDATPEPMRPVEVTRPRTETVLMPVVGQFGSPPAMPRTTAPPPLSFGTVEDPTHMPGPREIPSGNPEDPAPAPGRVPAGDSRSLRRGNEFALVYRVGTYVISRFGSVGTRGQWRVVEYPTSSSASHSYAKECSRFVSEGFSDYRD
jgi:hypothetical protein